MNDLHSARDRAGGFTLTELTVAVALAVSLLVALAAASTLLGKQAEDVRQTDDTRLEASLDEIVDHVRRGWLVERPSSTRVDVTDVYGGRTSYYLQGGKLKVDRPSGVTGELLDGVTSLSFDVDTTRRLREASPTTMTGPWWISNAVGPKHSYYFGVTTEDAPVVPGILENEVGLLTADESLAVGFTVSFEAPASVSTTSGVEEELLDATVDTLELPIAYAGVDGLVDLGAILGDHVEICHIPPGNPGGAITLKVGANAVSSHLAHGDTSGPCPAAIPSAGTLDIELYEARTAGDGRPYGPLLASKSYSADLLPAAGYWLTGGKWSGAAKKWIKPPTGMEVFQPTASLTIDLAAMGVTLEPGKGYTLVMYYAGPGMVAIQSTAGGNGNARRKSLGGDFVPAGVDVEFSLSGTRTYTQTAPHEVISRVGMVIELDDGRTMSASAAVDGQLAADNPWEGAISGELPILQNDGQ